MINNTINVAKVQLERHRALGQRSNLSIFEVAALMDVVTFGVQLPVVKNSSLFFNYQAN